MFINKNILLNTRKCFKATFLEYYHPERKVESPFLDSFSRKSKEVEFRARDLFPEGIDVEDQNYIDPNSSVIYTKSLVMKPTKVIYNGRFVSGKCSCKVDILVVEGDILRIYEVKSSTQVTNEHIIEVSYQAKILKECFPDYRIKAYQIYLNRDYVLSDNLNVEELFIIEDLTTKSRHCKVIVDKCISTAKDVLAQHEIPRTGIGVKCNKPYACPFISHCWEHIPENSVFEISRLGEVEKFKLYEKKIVKLEDVPRRVRLNDKQWMQIDCAVQNKQVVDDKAIYGFVQQIEYPVYAMDFETFQSVIPLYHGTKPYSHIPIQFSVHCLQSPCGMLTHSEYLHDDKSDPRPEFIKRLIEALGDKGTILVYNQKFEEGRLKEIARAFPQYSRAISQIIDRLVDLMVPFEDRYLYHPAQKGSSSLKKVLPAWIPELSYKDLEIFSGSTVGDHYEKMTFLKMAKGDQVRIRRALLEYCKMDTYALIRLLNLLEYIANSYSVKLAA